MAKKALLVVGDACRRNKLEGWLSEDLGYQVEKADSVKQALIMVGGRWTEFSLVLTDHSFSGDEADGMSLCHPATQGNQNLVFILMCDKLRTLQFVQACKGLGAHEVLRSPFYFGDLVFTIGSVNGRAEAPL